MKSLILSIFMVVSGCCSAQTMQQGVIFSPTFTGLVPITLEASCTGTGTATNNPCSGSMTVSAGDTILVGCYTNNGSFDPPDIVASDGLNGYYGGVYGALHPLNANDMISVFVLENSVAGTITPQCSNWEPDGMGISAYAFKGTPQYGVLDGAAAVNLFNSVSVAATNPTAGTAGSPTNANEAIVCVLDLASATATTAGSGYSPAGTLTGVTSTIAQYTQYQIAPAGTVNCNFGTTVTRTYTDSQTALINLSSLGGYHPLTGFYGVPAAAQTNGASATVAILNTQPGSISTLYASWSQLAGSPVTFDTSVHPIGTLKVLNAGQGHVIGDAATSIKFPAANTTSTYAFGQNGLRSNGTGEWYGSFMRVGTVSGNGNFCDNYNLDATLSEGNFTTQVYFDTSPGIHFQFERSQGNTPTVTGMNPSPNLNLNQDYFIITHIAGINEANDELYVFYEATPGTLPWVLHDHFTAPKAGNHIITTTATAASSGLSTITVASATGIVVGQSVYSATTSVDTGQIALGAKVTSVAGTSIGISIPTVASMAGTPVEFAGNTAFQTCSVTAGSATLTCGAGTGMVAGASGTGQYVGLPGGVAPGTWLASGSGTTWTMSQPAIATLSSQATQLWGPDGSNYGVHFGKYSSCVFPADFWYSGMIFDPYGTLLPLVANGSIPL